MKNDFVGKRVKVKNANIQFQKNASVIGTCTFFGFNTLLNKKQVTVDRMPIFLDNFNQVSLAE